MDYSYISIATASINAAKDIGRAALGIRDFNQVATTISQINDQLLKAQDSLFAHNAQLMSLQEEHFKAREELRELKEALAERGRYSLFRLSDWFHAYRVNLAPEMGNACNPSGSEPEHYVCQPCFDKGVKAVLHVGEYAATCPACKVIGQIKARTPIQRTTVAPGFPRNW